MPLRLEIVTPDARVYEDTIDDVVLPTTTGEIGILPGHQPLLTILEPGELRATKGGQTQFLAVGRGFAEVDGDRVCVLAESAIKAEEISDEAIAAALRRAEEARAGVKQLSDEESAQFEALARFAAAQQLVKTRRRG